MGIERGKKKFKKKRIRKKFAAIKILIISTIAQGSKNVVLPLDIVIIIIIAIIIFIIIIIAIIIVIIIMINHSF